MPIPTSLSVVLLVVAWLAVLVPMVAKRREHVPDTDEDTSRHFRVLGRASLRRQPKARRDEDEIDEAELTDIESEDDLEEVLLDNEHDVEQDEEDELEEVPEPVAVSVSKPEPARLPVKERRAMRVQRSRAGHMDSDVEAAAVADEPYEEAGEDETRRVDYRSDRYESDRYGADDSDEHTSDAYGSEEYVPDEYVSDEYGAYDEYEEYDEERAEDPRYRPVPRRRGRGGFDPEAAERTRAYKYSRRRKVTLILLLATLASAVAAYFLTAAAWSATAVFGLLLVAYLAYLRRQVRIEEDIRQRRLARLRRARQVRPEYGRPAGEDAGPMVPEVARAEAATVAPQIGRGRRRPVEFDDDDPAFDELEYYQPVTYRKAAGQ